MSVLGGAVSHPGGRCCGGPNTMMLGSRNPPALAVGRLLMFAYVLPARELPVGHDAHAVTGHLKSQIILPREPAKI